MYQVPHLKKSEILASNQLKTYVFLNTVKMGKIQVEEISTKTFEYQIDAFIKNKA